MNHIINNVEKLKQNILTNMQAAMLVFSENNIRYLSQFSGHAATILLTHKTNYLITDYRYLEQAKLEAKGFEVICRDRANQSLPSLICQLIKQSSCTDLFFENQHIDVAQWQTMTKEIETSTSIEKIIGISSAIETLRMIKSDVEISAISQAAKIADQALANILPLVKEGITERSLATELEYQMAKIGSEALSFATILLFGERSALPHGIPSDRALKKGDLILIDFGAVINGYRSDMTRTYIFGEASEKQKHIYQLVKDAQQAAIDAITMGVTGKQLYQKSANILLNSEYGAYAGEGLGHGVGLQLHEIPFLGDTCNTPINKGCVITIEPGIYIPDWGGVRIEDDVVITDKGVCIITQAPKELLVL
jgi:Xaa-Pro aminopeptidase/Xaa-Pro dipeptidase